MSLKSTLPLGIGLIVMLLLNSCQSEPESTITASPIVSYTNTATSPALTSSANASSLPTATVVIEVKETAVPVFEPTATATSAQQTATPSPTLATPTIAPVTLTPLPTFAPDELEIAVAELLINPMNCDVPCWWDAIPDETTVLEVQQFLTRHQLSDYKHDDTQIPDYIELWFGYDESANQFDFRIMYSFKDQILKALFAEKSPAIFEILRKHGRPDEVWLSTVSHVRDGFLAVRLNLVYFQKGMAVGYVVNGDLFDGVVVGCFADKESGHLRLSIPNSATSYQDFSPIFEEDRRYIQLEEATGLTMDDFVQRFSDPTQSQCIETPAELWD